MKANCPLPELLSKQNRLTVDTIEDIPSECAECIGMAITEAQSQFDEVDLLDDPEDEERDGWDLAVAQSVTEMETSVIVISAMNQAGRFVVEHTRGLSLLLPDSEYCWGATHTKQVEFVCGDSTTE